MVFPATPLDVTVELDLDGTWTDITSLVYDRDQPPTITRGRPDEQSQPSPASLAFEVNNRDGRFSPRNPTGVYYGLIGRNTRMRARLSSGAPDPYILTPVESDGASTPDAAALSITGDIDIRIEVSPDNWDAYGGLCNKLVAGTQISWTFYKNADNKLVFGWSTDGTTANFLAREKTSTAAITTPSDGGRLALRATLDVNNGASGNDVKFYTAPSIGGTWTQLGATVTTAGTTSIFDSTSPVEVGRSNRGVGLVGRVYGFELRNGIAGTLVEALDFASAEPGDTSWTTATAGRTWTLDGDSGIVDPAIRFQGEISEWPVRWDPGGNDINVPLQASGILRRLGQGATQLQSTLRRGYTTQSPQPRAYWPCEDADGATQIASGLGGPPMKILSGTPTLASFDEFACSQPIPTLQSSHWLGQVPSYTGTGDVQVTFLLHIPAGAAATNGRIVTIYTTGTVAAWILDYQGAGGDLRLRAFDSAGNVLMSPANIDFNVDGRFLRLSVQLEQNGANIDWSIDAIEVGEVPAGGGGGTLNSQTISRCAWVRVGGGSTALGDDIAIGHIAVHDQILDLFDLQAEFDAYVGETAGRRIERLCGEEGMAFRAAGNLDTSAAMGPQQPVELLTLLQDAADADGGILYEPRDLFGLAYRTRESMYNQAARLELDYDAKHLAALEPTDDDQQTRNDWTVTRQGGSSARAVQESGPLSVLAPPAGVGRYDTEVTLNLQTDGQLPDAAGWLLHLGTVDEQRYPEVGLNLAHPAFTGDADLSTAAEDLDIGDRLTIENPPAWLPPGQISLLAQGMVETLGAVTHAIQANCSPESPWGQVARFDDGIARFSSDGTTLAEALDTTETGVDVSTPSGPVWSHADGDFDILVGGERMTVTGVSGTGASQTFTVTRSVNSVVKSHSSGAVVELAHPVVYAR